MSDHKKYKPVAIWLYTTAAFVFAMVIIGAITRLTESGLSMVEWRPLIGTLPPLSEAEWQRVFDLYRETPEYQKEHFWMDIDDFKYIFFWEWFHRFMGRVIGLVYALPLIWFWIKGQIPPGYKWKLAGLFILGAVQGVLGWYMVKSGLVDIPSVSHYRLAAHLALAFLLFALLIWLAMNLSRPAKVYSPSSALYTHGWLVLGAVILTIFWGAYVAGLDAGLVYTDSFPKMGGYWIPPDFWALSPGWINIFENHVAVQWTHRWLGMATALVVLSFWVHAFLKHRAYWDVHALGAMIVFQVGLGIATLLSQVWLPLAVLHQAGALMTLMFLVICLHRYSPVSRQAHPD